MPFGGAANSRVIQLKQTKRIRNCATVNAAEQMPIPILTLAAPPPAPLLSLPCGAQTTNVCSPFALLVR